MAQQRIIVDLHISADEYLKLYQGAARDVVALALDGRRIRFPARILQPFVTRAGIDGRFAIVFDQQNKFRSIDRVR